MTLTELHQDTHQAAAEAFFLYLDFGYEDERQLREVERKMWMELMFASMTPREYAEVEHVQDIIIHTPANEHLLSVTKSGTVGHLALGQTRCENDSRISSDVVYSAQSA